MPMTTTPPVPKEDTMPNYAKHLTDHLAARGVVVEEWPTGGGCYALATADGRFLITDGDAGLPTGDADVDEVLALVSEYDEEGTEEVDHMTICLLSRANVQTITATGAVETHDLVADTSAAVAQSIAGWINSRN